MKKIIGLAVLSLLGTSFAKAQNKKDSTVIETKVITYKYTTKKNAHKKITIPGNVGVSNKDKSWYVGFSPSFDFGWSRFNTNNVAIADQKMVSDLSLSKGPHFGLNLFKFKFDVVKKYVAVNIGAGIDYETYHFTKPITFSPAQPTLTYTIDNDKKFTKNWLRSTYAMFPVMLKFKPAKNSSVNLMVGYELGLLLSGKTKQIEDGNKVKQSDNFNFNPVRQGLVFRVNYGSIGLYAKYYMNDVFANNQGPKGLQNYNFGISLGGF